MAITGEPYAYAGNNPINSTDPLGLWEIPEWVPVVGGSDCIRYIDDNCERNPKNQEGADFAGGVLNTVIPGQERRINRALGQEDKVDRCSGYYTAGEYAGYAVDAGFAVHGGVSAWRALNSGRGIGVGTSLGSPDTKRIDRCRSSAVGLFGKPTGRSRTMRSGRIGTRLGGECDGPGACR